MKIEMKSFKSPTESWTTALERAILALPPAECLKTQDGKNDWTRHFIFHEIVLPPESIYLDRTVELPQFKNFRIRGEGTRVNCAEPFAFRVTAGWSTKHFCDLMLDQCSVAFQAQARGDFSFRNVNVSESREPACVAEGEGVVGVTWVESKFSYCAGGFSALGANCDNWRIEANNHIRGRGPFVHSKSPGIHIRYNFLENTDQTNEFPWIWLEGASDVAGKGFTGGQCSVVGNRFGREIGTGEGPAVCSIQIGPRTPINAVAAGHYIAGNYFNGGVAKHAIRFTQPCQRTSLQGNIFNDYAGPIYQIDYTSGTSRDNKAIGNVYESVRQTAGIWSGKTLPVGWIEV